jgi:hypothetical protein
MSIPVLIASELADVPELQNTSSTGKVTIAKTLHLSMNTHQAMQAHLETIGIEQNCYRHISIDQSKFLVYPHMADD